MPAATEWYPGKPWDAGTPKCSVPEVKPRGRLAGGGDRSGFQYACDDCGQRSGLYGLKATAEGDARKHPGKFAVRPV